MSNVTKFLWVIIYTLSFSLPLNVNAKGGGNPPPPLLDTLPVNLQAEIVPDVNGGVRTANISGNTLITTVESPIPSTYIYQRTGTTWSLQAKLATNGTAVLCCNAKVSGDTAVIMGVTTAATTGIQTSRPFVYRRSAGVWRLETTLATNNADFAVDGDTVAEIVGANTATPNVLIYKRTLSATGVPIWTQQATLTTTSGGTVFPGSISLSGNTLVVSDYTFNAVRGRVVVYQRNLNTWTQQAVLTSTVAAGGFGSSVGVSGNNLVVGAMFESDIDPTKGVMSNSGAVYLYERVGTTWTQKAKFLNPVGARKTGLFGRKVSVSGNNMVAAAPGNGPGSVYAFKRGLTGWALAIADDPIGTFLDFSGYGTPINGYSNISVSGNTFVTTGWRLGPTAQTSEAFVFLIP